MIYYDETRSMRMVKSAEGNVAINTFMEVSGHFITYISVTYIFHNMFFLKGYIAFTILKSWFVVIKRWHAFTFEKHQKQIFTLLHMLNICSNVHVFLIHTPIDL